MFRILRTCGYCGIIDNKAYKNGYSISWEHKRVMEDVYIPNYKACGKTTQPLAFFTYIAGSLGSNINAQLADIMRDTGVKGSAMPVDVFINLTQDYADKGYGHQFLKLIFSINREIRISGLQPKRNVVRHEQKSRNISWWQNSLQ